ncbi:hypothetical protein HCJ25_14090 [Listeria sp. FSL L7-1426]|uniref:hypothetical protein n=1 Tax=Listeria cossartiae TaxID=2838249 RepID=UPI001629C017|nr:hypothetical protein [Listeria cossartiae]MBC1572774.1 hypothetical protein [Listeria cossartiae subsp. cossartiae]
MMKKVRTIPYCKHLVLLNQKKLHHQTKAQIYMVVELPMFCTDVNLALGLNAWIQKEPNLQVILTTKNTRTVRPLYLKDIQDIKVLNKKDKENVYVLNLTEQQRSRFIQTLIEVAI